MNIQFDTTGRSRNLHFQLALVKSDVCDWSSLMYMFGLFFRKYFISTISYQNWRRGFNRKTENSTESLMSEEGDHFENYGIT